MLSRHQKGVILFCCMTVFTWTSNLQYDQKIFSIKCVLLQSLTTWQVSLTDWSFYNPFISTLNPKRICYTNRLILYWSLKDKLPVWKVAKCLYSSSNVDYCTCFTLNSGTVTFQGKSGYHLQKHKYWLNCVARRARV